MKLYENIKALRKLNGWSQQELALKTGYRDRSSIAKIEAGLVDLPHTKVVEFSNVFGVQPTDLLGLEDSLPVKEEINSLFDQLDGDQQNAVLSFLRSMISNKRSEPEVQGR